MEILVIKLQQCSVSFHTKTSLGIYQLLFQMAQPLDKWMDDLQFYALFKQYFSNIMISNNGRLHACEVEQGL